MRTYHEAFPSASRLGFNCDCHSKCETRSTPIRISFFGGGTDYPDYFKKHGGAALSTTINKYIYISVKKLEVFSEFKYKIRTKARK